MDRPPLSRRQLLLSDAVSAGMLLYKGTASAGESARSPMPSGTGPSSTPLIPRRVLFAGAARSVVRISPDGRRIAFLG